MALEIIDETPQNWREYKMSAVRYAFPKTGEIINIGVVLEDENGVKSWKLIPSFESMAKCLKIEDVQSMDYGLEHIRNSIEKISLDDSLEIVHGIVIDSAEWINSEKDIDDTVNDLFEEIVTVAAEPTRHAPNEYASNTIVTKIKQMAEKKGYRHIAFRKHVKEAFNKQIDAVTENDEHRPAVFGEVCSPVVSSFRNDVALSIMALEMALQKQIVKEALLYMPRFALNNSAGETYAYAKRTASDKGIDVIDSQDYAEFLYALAKASQRAGLPLL